MACAAAVVRTSKIVKKRKALNVLRPNMTSLLVIKGYVSLPNYEILNLKAFERIGQEYDFICSTSTWHIHLVGVSFYFIKTELLINLNYHLNRITFLMVIL